MRPKPQFLEPLEAARHLIQTPVTLPLNLPVANLPNGIDCSYAHPQRELPISPTPMQVDHFWDPRRYNISPALAAAIHAAPYGEFHHTP